MCTHRYAYPWLGTANENRYVNLWAFFDFVSLWLSFELVLTSNIRSYLFLEIDSIELRVDIPGRLPLPSHCRQMNTFFGPLVKSVDCRKVRSICRQKTVRKPIHWVPSLIFIGFLQIMKKFTSLGKSLNIMAILWDSS